MIQQRNGEADLLINSTNILFPTMCQTLLELGGWQQRHQHFRMEPAVQLHMAGVQRVNEGEIEPHLDGCLGSGPEGLCVPS